ncbi:transporter substrate-binding domain-containing protein [Polaromonas sp. YR568]|uniref:transporter substrate-binding domain-containing protein n=1 Tax=Polaromonas sp. YR568 TaxID=1855301 RepID=UPI001587B6FA|nr:transporter substrate-binding domain-containing protein [Polaromonas sp. YR568]
MTPNTAGGTRRHLIAAAAAGLGLLLAKTPFAQSTPNKAGDALDNIQAQRLLRVAVPKEFPPFGSLKNGSPEGYDIAIARMLAIDLKVKLELVPVQSSDRLPYLRDGKVDLIIASLGKNAEREKQIDFTIAYAPLYNGVFGPPYGGVPEPSYFKERRIGVTKGSLEEELLLRRLPGAAVVRYENSAAIIDAYLKHEIEYIAAANVVIESIKDVGARDRTRFVLMLNESPCYIGVRKGEERLLARVNKFLREASESQALAINAMVWFKATLPADFFKRPSS